MNQIAAVAEPLIEDPGGKVLVEPEFKVNVGIEGPVWFAQQPALPVGIFLAELGLMLWLLVKGVNVPRWKEQASAARKPASVVAAVGLGF